jgi:16S rRNA (guanine966-N2)-methyltransferase
MRIISGKFKGHKLVSFEAGHIRPTTDRVKETLFNKLMGLVEGARVLDLFAGTGNLGLESLSRGAAFVDFVEESPKSLAILKKNLQKLKVTSNYKIHSFDVFKFLKNYEGPAFHIVLADPPFTHVPSDKVAAAIANSKVLGPGSIVAMEAASKEAVADTYPGLIRLDEKKFGDKKLHLFEAGTP